MEKYVYESYPVEDLTAELPRLSELMGSARGVFATHEEVDAFIVRLRDEWDG